jgi:hypothetical protein
MANEQNNNVGIATIKGLSNKSSEAIFGSDNRLSDDDSTIELIARKTAEDTRKKYGLHTGTDVIDHFTEVSLGLAMRHDDATKAIFDANNSIKKMLNSENVSAASSILQSDTARILNYQNYEAIFEHIPECATALDIYKDNIMSPDDYTKSIFTVSCNDKTEKESELIEDQCKQIIKKYKIEDKIGDIVEKTLILGDDYEAVLSLDREMSSMISDPIYAGKSAKTLNESFTVSKEALLESMTSIMEGMENNNYSMLGGMTANDIITKEQYLSMSSDERNILKEEFVTLSKDEQSSVVGSDGKTESKAAAMIYSKKIGDAISKCINDNFKVLPAAAILTERFEADLSKDNTKDHEAQSDIPDLVYKKTTDAAKDGAGTESLGILGSVVRHLDAEKVVDLSVDDVSYGYFYFLGDTSNAAPANSGYLGTATTYQPSQGGLNLSSNQLNGANKPLANASTAAAQEAQVSDQKMQLIAKLFLDGISKKMSKPYLKHNKDLKDMMYALLKQDYMMKKGVRVVFFSPDEVIHFKVPSIYRKIVFFAKLYLAVLNNSLLIKLGRSHDKRIFYVASGPDADYEQAISTVIQNIKSKEYKMSNINDISTILSNSPGQFDDYFIPMTAGGDRPIEIDSLQGMNADENDQFLNDLKGSMLSGMNVPKNLIDALAEVDYARTLSAQNSQFVRGVIFYQKLLTEPFTVMMRKLFINEQCNVGSSSDDKQAAIDKAMTIEISFPSPSTLNQSNLADMINTALDNATKLTDIMLPPVANGDLEYEEKRGKLTGAIARENLKAVPWDKYDEFVKKINEDDTPKSKIDKKAKEAKDNAIGMANGMDPSFGNGQQ